VSWSIDMIENPTVGPKFRPFSMNFLILNSVNCLALWTEFKVNTLDIKESDEHHLYLWFWDMSFLRWWDCFLFTLKTLLAFGILLKAPFITSNTFLDYSLILHKI
jgi:hypothetical protein